jgi:hypothetical protein
MALRKFRFIPSLVLILLLAIQFAVAAENYCKDPKSWKEWEALVRKYPNDLDLHYLHGLRIGLCVKVERGELTIEQATDIFERARSAIIEKKKAEPEKRDRVGL